MMYLQITDVVPDAVYDRAASQWFVLVVLGFVPCFTATTMWISESKVLRRETSDNTYAVWNFYVAKVLSVVPYEVFFGFTSAAIMYFAIGYQKDAAKFFLFVIVLTLTMLISQGYGLMAAAFTLDPNGALIIVSLVLLVLLSFTGFLTTATPVYFAWIKHISFLNFASSALWVNEMTGLELSTADGTPVSIRSTSLTWEFHGAQSTVLRHSLCHNMFTSASFSFRFHRLSTASYTSVSRCMATKFWCLPSTAVYPTGFPLSTTLACCLQTSLSCMYLP
mmetsp:Transcript_34035/g.96414  ORF Transcript_34035/g.96414 Transcript_34035/m.96414 type:complete len:278 (-) Transcript_34035:439-1272(-)